jgi:hypothetical protein
MHMICTLETMFRCVLNDVYRLVAGAADSPPRGEAGAGSGDGSSLQATAPLRRELVALMKRWRVRSLLDTSCGGMVVSCKQRQRCTVLTLTSLSSTATPVQDVECTDLAALLRALEGADRQHCCCLGVLGAPYGVGVLWGLGRRPLLLGPWGP